MSFIQGLINSQIFTSDNKPLTVDNTHIFATITDRDNYFLANPSELVKDIYIQVGVGFQRYSGSGWVDVSALVRGEKGDKGDGVTTFVGLTDSPNSYSLQAGKVVSVKTDESGLEFKNIENSWGSITGTLSSQTDLQIALNGKANSSHTHTIANVTNLQTTLDTKVDKVVGKGLSTNDLTNELKVQYDQSVLDSHTHTNKTLS